ncbi:hypothetical protein [Pantoea ananatis]|uniref:hypothetical protein n=1 Tax=Pantoea ananas TaxID=553 RepID=UPI0021E8E48D|nr:hypothetical protein [Pantoea ananatis]MCW0309593.1 hypothetical protein [Pantoea ananatis]MCW0341326.1 hypothetical protein [Pantoea ananatis]MCW0359808.1 hypothetical protein [Pantoea ananatis]MCW0364460.1 hypothetical protein [Pantoea ananatis]MCW1776878.1 hypothetical protein [Pantoea ananatis]
MSKLNSVEHLNTANIVGHDKQEEAFKNELLDMIRKSRPRGRGAFSMNGLDHLLVRIKTLYRESHHHCEPSLSELGDALRYVNSKLHSEVQARELSEKQRETHSYIYNYLDKYKFQLAILQFIIEEKPEGSGSFQAARLSHLLNKMRGVYQEITDGKSLTLGDLNNNLTYVWATLRKESMDSVPEAERGELNDYVKNYLSKYACQLQNVNLMYTNFMMAMIFKDKSLTLEEY